MRDMARRMSTVAVAVACAVSSLAAQVAPGDIGTFMGTWAVMLDTPQGAFDAMITMTPDGDGKAKVIFDVNGGQFSMTGTGTKK
jgi:hypothetical protein